jgi:hypothetical protein
MIIPVKMLVQDALIFRVISRSIFLTVEEPNKIGEFGADYVQDSIFVKL